LVRANQFAVRHLLGELCDYDLLDGTCLTISAAHT
jgi:hypothetical protein